MKTIYAVNIILIKSIIVSIFFIFPGCSGGMSILFNKNLSRNNNAYQILFRTLRDGNSEVYKMDADGSNKINLSNDGAYDGYARWVP